MKVNQGFWSFSKAIFPVSREFNYDGDPRYNPTRQSPLLGGFQPLVDMGKDFADTFKPYKSSYYIQRDFLQPFHGFSRVLIGLGYVVASPLGAAMSKEGVGASWLIYGLANMVKGLLDIATTPLTWLFKIPLRLLITQFGNQPPLPFQEKESVRQLIEGLDPENIQSPEHLATAANICLELHHKARNELQKGVVTLDVETEFRLFRELDLFPEEFDYYVLLPKEQLPSRTEQIQRYLRFFKPDNTEHAQAQAQPLTETPTLHMPRS